MHHLASLEGLYKQNEWMHWWFSLQCPLKSSIPGFLAPRSLITSTKAVPYYTCFHHGLLATTITCLAAYLRISNISIYQSIFHPNSFQQPQTHLTIKHVAYSRSQGNLRAHIRLHLNPIYQCRRSRRRERRECSSSSSSSSTPQRRAAAARRQRGGAFASLLCMADLLNTRSFRVVISRWHLCPSFLVPKSPTKGSAPTEAAGGG